MAELQQGVNTRADKRRRVWLNEESMATTLVTLFLDRYGPEGLGWDPMTIHSEVQDDFNVTLPQPVFDRLMAGVALVGTDAFYRSLPDFIHLCNILGGDDYDPTVFDPADAAECAWGITEALLLSPPDDEEENPFGEEIVAYIGEVIAAEGMIKPPDILRLGLKDGGRSLVERVNYDYSDDPVMFQAIWDMEKSRTDDINNTIKARLGRLVQQLEALPLDNGDTKDVVERLIHNLPQGTVTRAA